MIYVTQAQDVDHGFQAQCVIQRNHSHGVSVAGQLWQDPLSPAEGDKTTVAQLGHVIWTGLMGDEIQLHCKISLKWASAHVWQPFIGTPHST